MARLAALTLLILMSLPATAFAGSAAIGEVVVDGKYGYSVPALFYTASPGERNAIAVVRDGGALVLRDAGAAVQAGPGCSAIDARTVACRAAFGGSPPLIRIDAGDGDDAATVPTDSPPPPAFNGTSVHGGAGDDRLTGAGSLSGGRGRDVLTGSAAADVLRGGSGDDVLRAGAGDDTLVGDGSDDATVGDDPGGGDDTIDGGAGRDVVAFDGRSAGVRVDLAARTATTRSGERDRLAGIEDARGGRGADALLGDGGRNELNGRQGDDSLSGRAGDDKLFGGAGVDTMRGGDGSDALFSHSRGDALFGGAGDDSLTASYGGPRPSRRFRCGSGSDTVDGNPRGGLLVDCERVDPIGGSFSARPLAGGAVRFGWACTARFLMRCEVTASLRRGSRRAAGGSASSRDRARRSFLLRARPPLRRGDVVQVVARGTSIVQEGIRLIFAARWRIRL